MGSAFHAAALTAFIGVTLALPAQAQDAKPAKRAPLDPNQIVCEKEEVLGSRLATRKVCMTRAQWAEQRRTDRENVERSQTQLCLPQNGACAAGH